MNTTSSPSPERRSSAVWQALRWCLSPTTLIHALFWSWHAIWILFAVAGVLPYLVPILIIATFQGEVPWGITVSALGLIALPWGTLLVGWHLRDDAWKLFRLFYGVGGVAFTLLFVRLFLVREATAAVNLLLVTLAAGGAFYTAELFGGLTRLRRGPAIIRMVGYSALLIIGVYVGITMGLYCFPGAILAAANIADELWHIDFDVSMMNPFAVSLFLLFLAVALYGFVLVLGLPFAVCGLYVAGWWRGLRAWSVDRSWVLGVGITGVTVAGWLVAFQALTRQPQDEAFARLSELPATSAERVDALAHADEIRAGLLNAYLSPYRYWGSVEGNIQVGQLYRDAFDLDTVPTWPQTIFNRLAAPLLFDGGRWDSVRSEAATAYEQFFDRPLQEGEREAVLAAVSATYDRGEAEAGLLDVGQRRVWLKRQELDIDRDGDVGSFTLHEVYENQTLDQEEVFYYFNLPEHAAVTGLWLGDSDDQGTRFPYVVAPRGAAQQVYRAERSRRVDPALIEQVGPRQYRLRAFPIPPRAPADGGGLRYEAKEFHLWLAWTVLADEAGQWPLPRLAEARNVYWDRFTKRTLDGERTRHDGWLPPSIAAQAPPTAYEVEFGGYLIRGTPTPKPSNAVPKGSLAIVLDTSLSMGEHEAEVEAAFLHLTEHDIDADLYIAPSPWSGDVPRRTTLADADPSYYGGHSLAGVLGQFDALKADRNYAAVIVLSDAGSFALLDDPNLPAREGVTEPDVIAGATPEPPLWIVHFGGLPHAYADAVGDRIERSHGGVATGIEEALVGLVGGPMHGYAWSFEPMGVPTPDRVPPSLAPLLARALIGHLAAGMDGELSSLDAIHALAVEHSVVTPWSSMIVLVNEAQRSALQQASEAQDRFEREAESGTETLSTPGAPLQLTATPEPHEWLLALLAIVSLVAVALRRRPKERSLLTAA